MKGPARVSRSRPRRETVLCLALRQGHCFIRSGKSGCWVWFSGARAVREQHKLLGKATAQPLLAEAVLDAAAFSRERGAVVRALFAEVDHNEDAPLLFSSSFALLLRALDDAALAAGWSATTSEVSLCCYLEFLRRARGEPILQKEPDAKRLATVAVCARLFSQLRDRVARQLDDDRCGSGMAFARRPSRHERHRRP